MQGEKNRVGDDTLVEALLLEIRQLMVERKSALLVMSCMALLQRGLIGDNAAFCGSMCDASQQCHTVRKRRTFHIAPELRV